MADRLAMKDTFRFDEPGTLQRPGPIGRLVRLILGLLCLWLVWQLAFRSGTPDLTNPSFWIFVAFGMLLVPYVINIGFGVTWGAWPRIVSTILLVGAAAIGYLTTNGQIAFSLWATAAIWMAYVYGHLGISFVMSSLLATPGCEMRAIPHLLGKVLKRDTREHYCPGFIDNVDEWELNRRASGNQKTPQSRPSPTKANPISLEVPAASCSFTAYRFLHFSWLAIWADSPLRR